VDFSFDVEESEKVDDSEDVPSEPCGATWSQSASTGDWTEGQKWFRE